MKPGLSIDERGVLLHVTGLDGEGLAIPLEPATVFEAAAVVTRAGQALKTTRGRKTLFRAFGTLLKTLSEQGDDE